MSERFTLQSVECEKKGGKKETPLSILTEYFKYFCFGNKIIIRYLLSVP